MIRGMATLTVPLAGTLPLFWRVKGSRTRWPDASDVGMAPGAPLRSMKGGATVTGVATTLLASLRSATTLVVSAAASNWKPVLPAPGVGQTNLNDTRLGLALGLAL